MTDTPVLALFDLDHTLLDGDSDDLWCRFLLRHGLAERSLEARNASMGADYRAGQVSVYAFSDFYASMLAGHSTTFWLPWQARFFDEEIRDRLPEAARACVARHRAAGHLPVLTTAANRLIAEPTAQALGFEHLLATELEVDRGVYTGRIVGEPNMREGKLRRLRAWLEARGLGEAAVAAALASAWFYSDSINDLPLLSAVGHPVAVNPDPTLARHARAQGWRLEDLLGVAGTPARVA